MPTSSKNGPRSRGRTGAKYLHLRNRILRHNRICQFKGNDRWPACGELIDIELKWPDPRSPTINHKIPVADLEWDDPLLWDSDNAEPMHLVCNQRLGTGKQKAQEHPTSRDWFE